MGDYIQLKPSDCKNCYKCIRNCTVKSISFAGGLAQIVEDECILCGKCFVVCPQNAKEIRSDLDVAKAFIAEDTPVYASVAPSFVANYPDVTMASMRKALKALGFADAQETAVGATAVKNAYDALVRAEEQKVIIASSCPSVNLLVEKHFPQLLPCLAKVQTPMAVHTQMLRKAHPGAKVVFFGPCIAKKAEAEEKKPNADCVLTFEELNIWMQEKQIAFDTSLKDAPSERGKARFFPTAGGILKSMACDNSNYTYMSVDGTDACARALEDIASGNLQNCFIEMSSCDGGCIGGPAMSKENRRPVHNFLAVDSYGKAANGADFVVEDCMPQSLKAEFVSRQKEKTFAGASAIEEVLHSMGKTRPEDELNCGSCGYNTCREKAQAVLDGKAQVFMCLPFLTEKAQSFSDNIIRNTPNGILILNENMEIQQMNAAARKMLGVRSLNEVIGAQIVEIMEPYDFIEVLSSGINIHEKHVYLQSQRKYIEETILYDRTFHILMCIMRDITSEEEEKKKKEELSRHTVEVTDKVIEKQMRIVQEIASLLGETTAETKIALTKLKESLKDE